MGEGPGERAGAAVDEPHFQALESFFSHAVVEEGMEKVEGLHTHMEGKVLTIRDEGVRYFSENA